MLHNSTGALQPCSGQAQPRAFVDQAQNRSNVLLRAISGARTSCRACSNPCSISHSGSSSSNYITPIPCAPNHSSSYQRRILVVTPAWFGQQPSQQRLWDYDGSTVKQLSVRELELLHRLSFGHRNQRSYLVVLYKPDSAACQAFEAEVERLASGLRHEPAFVASALDVSNSEAATWVSNMLNVEAVPCVLFYPEAARGCLKFLGPDMSAAGMLAAVNKARKTALPATADSPGAAEWQLIEAATPLAVTALRAAAASGDRDAVVAALQQQMQPIQPTPLAVQQASNLWTGGRTQLWAGLLFCSLLFVAWDLKLADLWEDWFLLRRQAARLQGKTFTAQENLDDVVTYMMKSLSGQGQSTEQQQLQQQGLQEDDSASSQQQSPGFVGSQQQVRSTVGAPEHMQAAQEVATDQALQHSKQQPQQHSMQQQPGEHVEVLLEKQGETWKSTNTATSATKGS